MAFCKNCGNQVGEGVKFCSKCGQPVDMQPAVQQPAQPQFVAQPAQQPQYVVQQPVQQPMQQPVERKPIKPDSGMVMAILSTILCCLPTGIVAIIKANDVDKLYFAGDYKGAEDAASSARTWAYVGVGIAVVGWLVYIIFFLLLGLGGAFV